MTRKVSAREGEPVVVWKGPDDLRGLLVPLDGLVLNPDNKRVHGPRSIEALRGSLADSGQQKNIVVDSRGIVRAGNGTVEAARALGWSHVAAIRSDLDGIDMLKYELRDNRTAELSEWAPDLVDYLNLIAEQGGPDPAELGFTADDLAELRRGAEAAEAAAGEGGREREKSDGSLLALVDISIDEPRHRPEPGQVWTLGGRHVLVIACVLRGHEAWRKYLVSDADLFMPYPGPFVVLSKLADTHRLVLVQPDTYIGGHILDQYEAIHGLHTVGIVDAE